MNKKTITIDGIEYIAKDSIKDTSTAVNTEGLKFVIVRTYSAGVFAGYLEKRKGKEGTLVNAIRIWYWDGACSLSQLAMEGVTKPENCKFAVPVTRIELTEIVEVIESTETARNIIEGVEAWKK